MPETVLVTGAAGFIGSFICNALLDRGDHVIGYDNLEPQVHQGADSARSLGPSVEFIRGDVRDRDRLEAAVQRCDVILHQAAIVGVGQSMYEIARYVDVNTRGTAILLDILVNSKHHVRKVVVPGSMSAYGEGRYRCPVCGSVTPPLRSDDQLAQGQWELICSTCGSQLEPLPTDEDKPLQAVSVYAITKQDQEQLTLNVCKAYGLPAVVLRYFNVYGPGQSLDNPYTGAAAIFISRFKNGRPPLIFEDGNQTRDFTSVHDIAAANLAVMDDPRADYQVFNVGTGRALSIVHLARTLGRLMGVDIEPTVVGKFRKGDIRHCYADVDRIKRVVGWQPSLSFEVGAPELIEWALAVPANDRVESATEQLRARGLLIG